MYFLKYFMWYMDGQLKIKKFLESCILFNHTILSVKLSFFLIGFGDVLIQLSFQLMYSKRLYYLLFFIIYVPLINLPP